MAFKPWIPLLLPVQDVMLLRHLTKTVYDQATSQGNSEAAAQFEKLDAKLVAAIKACKDVARESPNG
jgi:hypothetical protein